MGGNHHLRMDLNSPCLFSGQGIPQLISTLQFFFFLQKQYCKVFTITIHF